MQKLLESWQKTLEQDEFKLSSSDLLSEVTIFELGLPAGIAEFINSKLNNASRIVKVKVGQMWKNTNMHSSMGNADGSFRLRLKALIDVFSSMTVETAMRHTRDLGLNDPGSMEDPEKTKTFEDTSDKAGQIIRNFKEMIESHPTGKDLMKADKRAKRFFKKGFDGTLPMEEDIEAYDVSFDKAIDDGVHYLDINSKEFFDYLNDDPDGKHYRIIKEYSLLTKAIHRAKQELVGREEPDQIIHKYKDGYYWYDIKLTDCSIESTKMGHCGTDGNSTTMYSLRSPSTDPDVEFGRDHWVTVGYDENKKIIHQIKGRDNAVPYKGHWKKIVDLLKLLKVTSIEERGQHSGDVDSFLEFRRWLIPKVGIEEDSWDDMKEKLMEYVHKMAEIPFNGIQIGFRMKEDAKTGVISYNPMASYSAEFPADILNEYGLSVINNKPKEFGIQTAMAITDIPDYKYSEDIFSKIETFFNHDDDPSINKSLGGAGSHTGYGNAPYVNKNKFFIWVPIAVNKIVGPWATSIFGSTAIPNNREDPKSYANFFDAMVRISNKEASTWMKQGTKDAMLQVGHLEGIVFVDLERSILDKELYTRGSLPPGTVPGKIRDWPTDWRLELIRSDRDRGSTGPQILEEIQAFIPTITLNTSALLDEQDLEVPDPSEIKAVLSSEYSFGREFLKLLFEKAAKNEYSPSAIPQQAFLIAQQPFESRPYIFEIDWGLELASETKDDISRDFLRIVRKINTKDEIADIAEEAFVNVIKAQFPESKLDESVIRMWKRAIG